MKTFFQVLTFIATVSAMPAFADTLIFDNADGPLGTTLRNAANPPLGVAAYLGIGGSDVTISQIAINAAPGQSGQLQFVIFSDIASPGSSAGSLLFSDTVNVSASVSLNYILSDPLSFTLQAGHYYDIGAIFNGTSITYSYDLVPDTQNGITSIAANQNINNFGTPTLTGHAGADVNIQLYMSSAKVPDGGATVMLLGMALSGLGFLRRKLLA
jgi:hypothetical protein